MIRTLEYSLKNLWIDGELCKTPKAKIDDSCIGVVCRISDDNTRLIIDIPGFCDNEINIGISCEDDCGLCDPIKITLIPCTPGGNECPDCYSCGENGYCIFVCECDETHPCSCNQICVGNNCQCPPALPYKHADGCCYSYPDDEYCKQFSCEGVECDNIPGCECNDMEECVSEGCGPCTKPVGFDCEPIICDDGVCDPATDECVECLTDVHCTEPNECCNPITKTCECCEGYVKDVYGNCVEKKDCYDEISCGPCRHCDENNECQDDIPPTGYVRNPYGDSPCFVKLCTCGSSECPDQAPCVEHWDGGILQFCFCASPEYCDQPCDGNINCLDKPGCICDKKSQYPRCVPNPCHNPNCTDEFDCDKTKNCGCTEYGCVPCDSLPCSPDCDLADGCVCPEGSDDCEVTDKECIPENVALKWVKVEGTPGTITDPGKPNLIGSCSVTPIGLNQADNNGGFYYQHQFNFTVNNGNSGTFYYSPQAGTMISFATGSSASLSHGDTYLMHNWYGFRVIYVDNDGREIIWQAVNTGITSPQGLQSPNTWNCSVFSSTGTPPISTGGTSGYWKLVSTDSNFTFSSTTPIQQEVHSSSPTPITVSFTNGANPYELIAHFSGCGQIRVQFNMLCGNTSVSVWSDIFEIPEDHCGSGEGGPGDPCDDITNTMIDLLKIPLYHPTTNSFTVIVDPDSIAFDQLYYMTNICWGTDENSEGFDDISFAGNIYGSPASDLYRNIVFTKGGCVTFGEDCVTKISICETASGRVCFLECDNFDAYIDIENESVSGDDTIKDLKGYPAQNTTPGAIYSWKVNSIPAFGDPNGPEFIVFSRINGVERVHVDLSGIGSGQNAVIYLAIQDDCDGVGSVLVTVPENPCVPNPMDTLTLEANYSCQGGLYVTHLPGENISYRIKETVSYSGTLGSGTVLPPGNYTMIFTNEDGCEKEVAFTVPQCWKCNANTGSCVEASASQNTGYDTEVDCNNNCNICDGIVISVDQITDCSLGVITFQADALGLTGQTYTYQVQVGNSVVEPDEVQPINQGTPATFQISSLLVDGSSNFLLIVTDGNGCVKEQKFSVPCVYEVDCNNPTSCYEVFEVEVGTDTVSGDGTIESLVVKDQYGSNVQLLGSYLFGGSQIPTSIPVSSYNTFAQTLQDLLSTCDPGASVTLTYDTLSGKTSFRIENSVIEFVSITFTNTGAGGSVTEQFNRCCTDLIITLSGNGPCGDITTTVQGAQGSMDTLNYLWYVDGVYDSSVVGNTYPGEKIESGSTSNVHVVVQDGACQSQSDPVAYTRCSCLCDDNDLCQNTVSYVSGGNAGYESIIGTFASGAQLDWDFDPTLVADRFVIKLDGSIILDTSKMTDHSYDACDYAETPYGNGILNPYCACADIFLGDYVGQTINFATAGNGVGVGTGTVSASNGATYPSASDGIQGSIVLPSAGVVSVEVYGDVCNSGNGTAWNLSIGCPV